MKKSLTKAGAPRKNAPGAGRPTTGRTKSLPRVSKRAWWIFNVYALKFNCSVGSVIERAAELVPGRYGVTLNLTPPDERIPPIKWPPKKGRK